MNRTLTLYKRQFPALEKKEYGGGSLPEIHSLGVSTFFIRFK